MKKQPDKNSWDKKRLLIESIVAFAVCIIGIKYGEQKTVINYNGDVVTYKVYQDVVQSIDEANDLAGEAISGEDVANFAQQFEGVPYVYGGMGLTTGVDSSGFVKTVFKHFGLIVPRTVEGMKSIGEEVIIANAKAGDIICTQDSAGIYLGSNRYVYASKSADKVIISEIDDAAIVSVRRLIK